MAPELSRAVRRVTFLLLALAAVAVEVAAVDTRALGASLGLASVWVAVAAVAGRFVPVPADPKRPPPRWVLPLLVALAAAPFAVEPLRRDWTGDGYPLELQMVFGLRNVGLGLAACGGWLLCLRLACVVSLFLTLFAAAMTNHPAVLAVLGLYTATGSVWLVLAYWTGLKAAFVAPERVVAVEVQQGRERLPWAALGVLVLGVGGALALALVGPKRVALTLGELVPTSGGTGETDPFARYGTGDGPEEVAGSDARAAGMVETDQMIEDSERSLVDVIGDTYGPPHKPPEDQERMAAGGLAKVIQTNGRPPDNRRPSRDFDTARAGPKGDRAPPSRAARALFEVQGRTPLHVRVVAYEHYDAAGGRWLEARKPAGRSIEREGGDWMRPGQLGDAGWYAADERHRLKAADLTVNLVPTPAMTARFRINRVDRPDYYDWDYDGVLTLAGRRTTPPGVVVTTDCRTLAPHRLPESAFGPRGAAGDTVPVLREVPPALRPEVERLARAWAGDRPRGWPQVEAVLAGLRTGYALDRAAAPPAGHPAPVLWFLAESRRGPDYLFATAAALLLRALDYPARVCLGYYAGPAAYDPETAHTPVAATDLHVWPEVLLRDGQWLVVEPTPGYEVLGPARPLSERVLDALAGAAAWAWRRGAELAALLAAGAAAWARRRHLIDAGAVRLWRAFPGRTLREQVRGAAAVLERRGRWAGRPRPRRQTAPSWLQATLARPASDADLARMTRMIEWAAYAAGAPPWPEAEVLAVCRRVLDEWTLARWHAPSPPNAVGARTR